MKRWQAGLKRRDAHRARNRQVERDRRNAEGLCATCGARPNRPNRRSCKECLAKQAKSERIKRRAWKENDLCRNCGGPLTDEWKICGPCREYRKARTERWRETGACALCGNPTRGHRQQCDECNAKRSAYARKRSRMLGAKGLCKRCGKVPHEPGFSECKPCRDAARKRRSERSSSLAAVGLCGRCKADVWIKDDGTPSRFCRACLDQFAEMERRRAAGRGGWR